MIAPADILTLPQLGARRGRSGWLAHCPAHKDRARSLSLRLGADGRLLVNCFAGCGTAAIVAALGLELRDLFPSAAPGEPRSRRTTTRPLSPLAQARVEILREGRRQQGRLVLYRPLFLEADTVRAGVQLAARARRVATTLGDVEPAWSLLASAVDVERAAWCVEAGLDELLAEKRPP